MAGDLDAFYERLNRINARQGGPKSAQVRAAEGNPVVLEPKSGRVMLRLLSAVGFAAGTAIVLVVLSQTVALGPGLIGPMAEAGQGIILSGL